MQTLGSKIIDLILENEQINANTLANLLGLSRTQPIYDIQKGKVKKISPNYARKIIESFPYYNYNWLLTGEGDMIKRDTINIKGNSNIGNTGKTGNIYNEYNKNEVIENIDILKNEIENLKQIIASKDEIIKTKDELISLLKENRK